MNEPDRREFLGVATALGAALLGVPRIPSRPPTRWFLWMSIQGAVEVRWTFVRVFEGIAFYPSGNQVLEKEVAIPLARDASGTWRHFVKSSVFGNGQAMIKLGFREDELQDNVKEVLSLKNEAAHEYEFRLANSLLPKQSSLG